MIHVTGTQIQYLHLCHRKLWLFANSISMEQTSDLVYEGKLVDEYSYAHRSDKWQQIEIEGIKIDYFDPRTKTLREVKKSNKRESAHVAQVKFYLYVLRRNNIEVDYAVLEYPKLRQTEDVFISDLDTPEIEAWEKLALEIIDQESCPPRIKKTLCKQCSYFDFCFVEESI